MSGLLILRNYYFERFTPYPWMIVPFIFSFILWGSLDRNFLETALYLLGSLPYYRLLDDIMMRKWDANSIKQRSYFTQVDDLKKMIFLPLALYLALTFYLYGQFAVLISLAFLGLSLALYRWLDGTKMSLFISILKYPLLGYLCLHNSFNHWASVASFLFLYHEVVSEKMVPLSTKTSIVLFLFILSLRAYGSFA